MVKVKHARPYQMPWGSRPWNLGCGGLWVCPSGLPSLSALIRFLIFMPLLMATENSDENI
ncbi:hypothetical protein BJY04DRAFT_187674 [Aspergillus karnatakaensis]|uniref:uncharacterized protein n=1 Tax=Aspergillus karnatakaensis TaxID=1810916 RepID=UPI003CCC985E